MRKSWHARSFTRVVSIAGAGCALLAGTAIAADIELTLPAGFSATVVHEGQGTARHIDVAANGDIYVAGRNGLSAMRDTNRDGKPEVVSTFGDVKGTEVRVFKNWLYVSDDVGVYRYALSKGQLVPGGARETVVSEFPRERQHSDKTFALDGKGTLYINVGALRIPARRRTGRKVRWV